MQKSGFLTSRLICHMSGLEAVSVFLSKTEIDEETAHEVISGVMSSCVGSTRNTVTDMGKEILMLCIESGHQKIVTESLVQGLRDKSVRRVTECVVSLKEAIRDFGTDVIEVTPIIPCIPDLVRHTSAAVREEALQFIVEIYQWKGLDVINVFLEDLPDIQRTRISETLDNVNREKSSPVRFLRSHHDYRTKKPKLD